MAEDVDVPDRYLVVVNDEEQYSIWPADREPPPAGWRVEGGPAPQDECLAYIAEHWTDLRPASLRRAMDARPG